MCLGVCTHTHVYMYTMHTHTHTHTHTQACTHAHTHTYACTYAHTHSYPCTHALTCVHVLSLSLSLSHIHTHTHTMTTTTTYMHPPKWSQNVLWLVCKGSSAAFTSTSENVCLVFFQFYLFIYKDIAFFPVFLYCFQDSPFEERLSCHFQKSTRYVWKLTWVTVVHFLNKITV